MAMTINTNIQSLNAQRNLGTSQSSLSTSMQRLSSGMRINSAKDDAAGLAIAERMSAQVRGLNQAARNANDGVSLAQTAEGALGTIGGNLQRIRELAVQSRNATNSGEDRAALQKEVSQLKEEINRVATTTNFNGTNLLDGSFTSKAFQVGANQGQTIDIASVANAQISELGNWSTVGQKQTQASYSSGQLSSLKFSEPAVSGQTGVAGAFTSTGNVTLTAGQKIDISFGGQSYSMTLSAAATDNTKALAELNDAAGDFAKAGLTISGGNASALVITGPKQDGLTITAKIAGVDEAGSMTTAGKTDIAAAAAKKTEFTLTPSAAGATAKTITLDKDYTGKQAEMVADIQKQLGQGYQVEADGDAGFKVSSAVAGAASDFTIATTTAGVTAYGTSSVAGKDATTGEARQGFASLTVSTVEGADEAILAMDAALKSVNSARADLGAIQNRFESVVSNLNVNSENLSASKSRITDADFAAETANLSRSQILQQAGTAMVAQANQLPQGVLSLLR